MAERGGRGRGRRGGRSAFLTKMAQDLNMNPSKLKAMNIDYEPEKRFPDFIVPRPTKLSQDETNMVKYYKNLRKKILEETPFYITPKKRLADDEDDGKAHGE